MTDEQQLVLKLMRKHLRHAEADYQQALASMSAEIAGYQAWHEYNGQVECADGSKLPGCPYSPIKRTENEAKCKADLDIARAAHDYIVDLFMGAI